MIAANISPQTDLIIIIFSQAFSEQIRMIHSYFFLSITFVATFLHFYSIMYHPQWAVKYL